MAKDKNREPVAAVPQEEEGDEDAESEGEFEVESIVGHKVCILLHYVLILLLR